MLYEVITHFRSPVLTAWSTPGAALLGTSLVGLPMGEAIGAFLFASALITLCGVTGWVETLMKHIPKTLAAAMLAGVLVITSYSIHYTKLYDPNTVSRLIPAVTYNGLTAPPVRPIVPPGFTSATYSTKRGAQSRPSRFATGLPR